MVSRPLTPQRHWLAPVVGLVVALVLPAIFLAGGPGVMPQGQNAILDILLNEAVVWALALSVLAIVVFWERRPLSSIGLVRPTFGAVAAGGAVMLVLIVLALGLALAIKAAGISIDNAKQTAIVMSLPIWLQLFVVISAGITEEILFRGYPIERITELTGRRWLGALVPVIVFGAVHAPFWGVTHAVVAGFQGLLLTIVYMWRRNLWTNITAHALLDGTVFLLLDIATSHGMIDV
jgi:membrane protease YdiL (CAAX protease family)